jgi:hypothetical protein
MKLIRLKSDNNTVFFNNTIQSNLILPPSSRIALQNLSFEKKSKPLIINSTNHTFEYQMDTEVLSVVLTNAEYQSETFNDFVEDFQTKMLLSLNIQNESMIGAYWNVSEEGNLLNIVYDQNGEFEIIQEQQPGYQQKNITYVQATATDAAQITKNVTGITPNAVVAGDGKNYVIMDGTNGCGIVRIKIGDIPVQDATHKGYYLAISTKKIDTFNGDFPVDQMDYAIYLAGSTANYQYMSPDTIGLQDSGLTMRNNGKNNPDADLLEIAGSKGKIQMSIYTDTDPTGNMFKELATPDSTKNYYPYLVILTEDATTVQEFSFTPHLDWDTLTLASTPKISSALGAPTPPIQDLGIRDYRFKFETLALANQLGFNTQSIPSTGVDNDLPQFIDFISDNEILFVDNTECYLIELLNLNIDSYDASLGQQNRRNLLAVVQNGRTRDQKDVYYDANTPLFIDLNNAYDIPLHNIQLRILDSSEQVPAAEGFSNMTILIE